MSLPSFRADFHDLNENVRDAARSKIRDVLDTADGPLAHDDVKFLQGRGDRGAWRISVGERGAAVDHRIFFDLDPDGTIYFLRIRHRDHAYDDELSGIES